MGIVIALQVLPPPLLFNIFLLRFRRRKSRFRKTCRQSLHGLLPDRGRIGGTVERGESPWGVVANPHGHCVVRRHSAEPAVLAVVGGSRLSGRLNPALPAHSPGGSPRYNALHNVYHHGRRLLGINLLRLPSCVDVFPGQILHSDNTVRFPVHASVFQGAEGAGHLLCRHAVGKASQGSRHIVIVRHNFIKLHLSQVGEALLRRHLIKQPPGRSGSSLPPGAG